jgi:hypothetical protein
MEFVDVANDDRVINLRKDLALFHHLPFSGVNGRKDAHGLGAHHDVVDGFHITLCLNIIIKLAGYQIDDTHFA